MSGGKIVLLTITTILFFFLESSWLVEFAAGVVTFWSLSFFLFWGVISLICVLSAVAKDSYWVTGVLFGFTFLGLVLLGVLTPIAWVTEHPYITAGVFFGYFAVACMWMGVRWVKFIEAVRVERNKKIRDFVKEEYSKVIEGRKAYENRSINSEQAEEWRTFVLDTGIAPKEPVYLTQTLSDYLRKHDRTKLVSSLGTATSAPLFRENKAQFFTYFFYWPLDALIYVFGELLLDFWNLVVQVVQGVFDKYANKRIQQKINLDE